MKAVSPRILSFDGTLGSAFGAHGGNSCDDVLTPFPDDDDTDGWDFADGHVNSHVDVCALYIQESNDLTVLWCSANATGLGNPNRVVYMEVQNMDAVAERNLAVAPSATALEPLHVTKETKATMLRGWILE